MPLGSSSAAPVTSPGPSCFTSAIERARWPSFMRYPCLELWRREPASFLPAPGCARHGIGPGRLLPPGWRRHALAAGADPHRSRLLTVEARRVGGFDIVDRSAAPQQV